MLSATATMPVPGSGPSLGRKWIKANAIVAVVYGAIGVLSFTTDTLLGTSPGTIARSVAAILALLGTVAMMGAYAMLTGTVLSEKLPTFSTRGWNALHIAIGLLTGAAFAAAYLLGNVPGSGAPPAMPADRSMLIGGIAIALVFGLIFGAAMGSLQALVLRRSARGLGAWIALSAVASSVFIAVLMGVALMFTAESPAPMQLLAREIMIFGGVMASALVMLPAVKRLAPRV